LYFDAINNAVMYLNLACKLNKTGQIKFDYVFESRFIEFEFLLPKIDGSV